MSLPFTPETIGQAGLVHPSILGPALMTECQIDYLAAGLRGSLCLSVGAWVCGSDCLLAVRRPDIQFHAVDNWPAAEGVLRFCVAALNASLRPNVWVHRLPFCAFARVAAPVFDSVVIDAKHTLEEVRHDVRAGARLVAPGGSLYCHDYGLAGTSVQEAVDEFVAEHEWKITDGQDTLVCLTKLERK